MTMTEINHMGDSEAIPVFVVVAVPDGEGSIQGDIIEVAIPDENPLMVKAIRRTTLETLVKRLRQELQPFDINPK